MTTSLTKAMPSRDCWTGVPLTSLLAVDQQPRGPQRPRGQFVRIVNGPLAGRYARLGDVTLVEPTVPVHDPRVQRPQPRQRVRKLLGQRRVGDTEYLVARAGRDSSWRRWSSGSRSGWRTR